MAADVQHLQPVDDRVAVELPHASVAYQLGHRGQAGGIGERRRRMCDAGTGEVVDVRSLDRERRLRIAFRHPEVIVVQVRDDDRCDRAPIDPERVEQGVRIVVGDDPARRGDVGGEAGVDQHDVLSPPDDPERIDQLDVVVPRGEVEHEAVMALRAADDQAEDLGRVALVHRAVVRTPKAAVLGFANPARDLSCSVA